MNVTVSQCPMGASAIRRSPQGLQPFRAHHIGGDCCLVDKYEAGGIKPALLTDPASARASHVGALALLRPQAFLRNGNSSCRLEGLEREAEGLRAPMQI